MKSREVHKLNDEEIARSRSVDFVVIVFELRCQQAVTEKISRIRPSFGKTQEETLPG